MRTPFPKELLRFDLPEVLRNDKWPAYLTWFNDHLITPGSEKVYAGPNHYRPITNIEAALLNRGHTPPGFRGRFFSLRTFSDRGVVSPYAGGLPLVSNQLIYCLVPLNSSSTVMSKKRLTKWLAAYNITLPTSIFNPA